MGAIRNQGVMSLYFTRAAKIGTDISVGRRIGNLLKGALKSDAQRLAPCS